MCIENVSLKFQVNIKNVVVCFKFYEKRQSVEMSIQGITSPNLPFNISNPPPLAHPSSHPIFQTTNHLLECCSIKCKKYVLLQYFYHSLNKIAIRKYGGTKTLLSYYSNSIMYCTRIKHVYKTFRWINEISETFFHTLQLYTPKAQQESCVCAESVEVVLHC